LHFQGGDPAGKVAAVSFWGGKSDAEWQEIWRQERLREDAMLAFHDEIGGRMTKKALAAKFNLTPTRVSILVRRHVEALERGRMQAKIARLEENERLSAFAAIAERLWMDLGWLVMELEKRRDGCRGGI
jgi:hypothetical protein